jgi:hypothetical protein
MSRSVLHYNKEKFHRNSINKTISRCKQNKEMKVRKKYVRTKTHYYIQVVLMS